MMNFFFCRVTTENILPDISELDPLTVTHILLPIIVAGPLTVLATIVFLIEVKFFYKFWEDK